MDYNIVLDKRDVSNITTLLQRFPEDWQKDAVSMAIFRRASKPMLVTGEQYLLSNVRGFRGKNYEFRSKLDKTKTIMRVGLVNKGIGRLGHLFNFGTVERMNYSTGRPTGRIDKNKFGSGWWDKAVNVGKPQVEREIDKVAPQIITRHARKYKK